MLKKGYPHQLTAWALLASLVSGYASPAYAARRANKRVASEKSAPAESVAKGDRGDHADEEASEREPADKSGTTVLAQGFLLQLASSDDARLNGSFRIRPDGVVDLPYSVSLHAAGSSLARFRAEVLKAYKAYFNEAPNLRVNIRQKRFWIEVQGLVAKPGNYLVRRDSPLDEIISLAGGISDDLTNGYVRVEQGDGKVKKVSWVDLSEYYKHGSQTEVPSWIGADRVFFQKEKPDFGADALNAEAARKVQVIGEVRNPGELTYRKEADVYYYLVKTGGPTAQVDLEEVEQIRPDPKTGKRERVVLGDLASIKSVEGGDILLFRPQQQTTSFTRALTTTSVIVGIVSTLLLGYLAVKATERN